MTEQTIKTVGSECLGFKARLLSRVVTVVYDDAPAEVGLKVSQFSMLNAIANREEVRLPNWRYCLRWTSQRSAAMWRACAREDGFGWNPARVIGAAIESRSRKKEWLCCDKATPPGKRPKTWSPTGWGRTESQL